MKSNKLKKGFTLVELIIVIAIIALLASLAFMALSGETGRTRDTRRDADLNHIENLIVTANSKGETIRHNNAVAEITTNLGAANGINAIRGAKLVSVGSTLFDTTLATPNADPKGTSYIAAFVNDNIYQIIGTKENPDTAVPTAVVKGNVREGAVVDQVRANIGLIADEILVSNPDQFVVGDVITIDNEDMVVAGYSANRSTISVYGINTLTGAIPLRSVGVVGNIATHNAGAKVKMKYFAPRAGGALCLGKLDIPATSWSTQAGAVQGIATAVVVTIETADPASANAATAGLPTGADWTGGKVCANHATAQTSATYAAAQTTVNITSGNYTIPLGIITNNGTTIPYNTDL